jgi:hypothetical protein
LVVATDDQWGAGKAAYRIFKSLQRANHNVNYLVRNKTINSDDAIIGYNELVPVTLSQGLTSLFVRAKNKLKRKTITDPDYYFFGLNESNYKINLQAIIKSLKKKPDIIIITWISKFLGPQHISRMCETFNSKLLIFPMDMSPLTGGCHYSWDCDGYAKDCSNCPAIIRGNKNKPRKNLLNKLKYYQKSNVNLAIGSVQLLEQAKKSTVYKGLDFKRYFIPIDEHVFNRDLKSTARDEFNIPEDKLVIFYGSTITGERRKGAQYFIEALNELKYGQSISAGG